MRWSVIFLHCLLLILFSACSVISQNSGRLKGYQAGQYNGQALNTTANQRGKVVFDLYDLDSSSGNVLAYLGFSDGLSGDAWLTGSINKQGELELTGTLLNFQVEIQGHATPRDSIKATYQLDGTSHQEGNFEVSFQHDLSNAPSNKTFADMIGAWEIGGGMPAQTNPITGGAAGISFVEARHLDIFPDGQFKHTLSHRHCESVCCREDATLEQGTILIEDKQLVFNITGGGTITRDNCNPRLNHEGSVDHGKKSFTWSLKEGEFGGQPGLCIVNASGESTCYKKQ